MGFYLLDNPNPTAFGGFHGYTTRREQVRLIVVHTSESTFDLTPPDDGAENVARYLSQTDRQASYHDITDSDSWVRCLPWDHTAFGARGHNAHAIHVAFAGRADGWDGLDDSQVDRRLRLHAQVVAKAAEAYDIPVRRLQGAAARADGATGICGHADLDPTRRHDPGDRFPWSRYLALVNSEGDDMTGEQAAMLERIHTELTREDIRGTVARYVATTGHAVGRMERVWGQGLANLGSGGDVDPAAVAAAIADELGDDVARQVADELARRLAG